MIYAVIPRRNMEALPWIFNIPIGTWQIERMEDSGAVQCYIGLKGDAFSEEQQKVINQNEGLSFSTDEEYVSWYIANGVIPEDMT